MLRYLFLFWMVCFAFSSVLRADANADDNVIPNIDDNAGVAAYLNLAEHDARLARIGFRISMANAEFCPETLPNLGWVLHDIAQYPDDDNVTQAFRFPTPISVLKIVEGGPAERAGVLEGDGFIGLESEDLSIKTKTYSYKDEPVHGFNNYQRLTEVLEDINQTLARFAKTKNHNIIIKRDGEILKLPFLLHDGCTTHYILDAQSKIDAGANGEYVRITLGLSEYLSDDDEYAAAIAHELAHNILQHRILISDGKLGKGPLAGLGKNKRIRTTEEQADRLAIWLMANAGFDVAAGPRMIERLRKRKGLLSLAHRTHNKWKKRLGYMQQEIEALNNVPANSNGGRIPPLIDSLKYQ